ncbi:ABC transporter ATP-binding protein [Sulfidibacter corallicola]|uniref:ABC transporter ATP-binding protein n=1 Tax=Sulfidibacter corallicola TaxID=2818388 RepID=A0A8A4TEZ7_SULCO|nr:ABC transporter ATP-binding protein [Sulfidibacter corallicola]QTD47792.1 ABC transporter ATP-binding protein [Sulfidibacter corallicola]
MSEILKVQGVGKAYDGRGHQVRVLEDVNFVLNAGETAAIVGPSGSGKTTLLSLCAGLDTPTQGKLELLGHDLAALSEEQRAALRNRHVGFIFQSFHLMPSLTALENVMLPRELAGVGRPAQEARELLDQVGLADRADHYPAQLSGGEQQRIAIARAFINQPMVLFADEPTGNLDRATSDRVTELLFRLNTEKGTTLALITHDLGLARMTSRLFHLKQGRVVEEIAGREQSSGRREVAP